VQPAARAGTISDVHEGILMKRFSLLTSGVAFAASVLASVPGSRCYAAGDTSEVTTLAALLTMARADNPEIKAAEARYQAMRQRPIQERTLPDPTLGVRYHNEQSDRITFGESDFSFVEFFAEQEIPFPGKLGLRGDMASREAEREGAMRDVSVFMVLAKVAASFTDLMVVDRSTDILGESLDTLGLIVEQANVSYRVGTAAQQDVLRATVERDMLKERLTMLVQKRTAAAATINSLLNRSGDRIFPRVVWSDVLPSIPPLSVLTEELAVQAPELRAAQEDRLKTEAELELAHREYLPDLAFMGAYTNKNGLFPEWELGMRMKLPLYFWRRQRAGVAEASYAREAAEHTQRNVRVSLEGRLRELYSMAEAAQRLIRLYTDSLIPQATLTLQSARASYAVGKVDFLTALNAFTAVLEYRMRYAEEVGNLSQARAEIGPLVGRGPLDWEEKSR
jgi:outer membrane protein TolC